VVGSGFGGSVSALRLAEKGYRVLVLEKGKWLEGPDFPKTNWDLRRWLWLPQLGWKGLFKITIFRHVTVFSGVGVGGGSLVYANTLPKPKTPFFKAPSWAHLADWEAELAPHYETAWRMLGAAPNPLFHEGDRALQAIAKDLNKEEHFDTVKVAVYFGEANKTVPDPYFGGRGPDRTGCNHCGACMLGCPNNSKNTLDKNYLYLAQKLGAVIQAEATVVDVRPLDGASGSTGYEVTWRDSFGWFKRTHRVRAKGVVLAGGVLGTNGLLTRIKKRSLPRLSDRLGMQIRTNSESLLGVTSFDKAKNMSKGLAITSILHTDEHTHLEVVRYSAGSGFFRIAMAPAAVGKGALGRLWNMLKDYAKDPVGNWKGFTVDDWAKRSQILLFMQSLDSTLQLRKGWFGLGTRIESGPPPTPFIPEAHDLAHRFAQKVDGKPFALATETVLGIPSTAHILGGACMGTSAADGVVDHRHRVFGYDNLLVCDGSVMSANPGVNPSLTITALAERAMSFIPPKA
jgi:cholesterol oxidase